MRILVSAYACEPGRGSEPGAGWAWARAAAEHGQVWVLTHATNRPAIDAELAADPALATRLHPTYLQNARWARRLRTRGPSRMLYYLVWQLTVCPAAARRLHAVYGFDLTHHVTYAADWMPAGVSAVRSVPFVWGPVGGSATTGQQCWRLLGPRARVIEAVRAAVLGALRSLIGHRTADRAAVVLGQNSDVAAAFSPRPVLVQPNVAVDPQDERRRPPGPGSGPGLAIYAGRVVAWKGLRLALDALRRPGALHWSLEVYGDGPQRHAMQRLAKRWGLDSRVRFHGSRPRVEIQDALARADVFLFPSLHDAAGWAVAEALAAGCPTLCLASGGPATLIGLEGGLAVPTDGDVIGDLAAALDRVRRMSPDRARWSGARLPGLLGQVYGDVVRQASVVGSWSPSTSPAAPGGVRP